MKAADSAARLKIFRAPFAVLDSCRRAQGDVLQALGCGPRELAFRESDRGTYWRVRDYAEASAAPPLLIIAAPIKRPYIWDLSPSVSAIGYCLERGLHVYLLEWLPVSNRDGSYGIDDYISAISCCVARISAETSGARPFVIGHSLGGTLAAIFGTVAAETIRGLVLLGAPLCFEPGTSAFRDALMSAVPPGAGDADPLPGSLLSWVSAMMAPNTFIWSRFMDAALSCADDRARDLHARVERWALDEVALPGKLVCQIIEGLYRENRLCRGTLKVAGKIASPAALSVPTLAVVNLRDDVAPLLSVTGFTDAMPTRDVDVIPYEGELGVCLQHLGILIGRTARGRVWPMIAGWLHSHR